MDLQLLHKTHHHKTSLTNIAVDRPSRGKCFHRLWPSAAFHSEASDNPRQVEGLLCSGSDFLGFVSSCTYTNKADAMIKSVLFWLWSPGCWSFSYLWFITLLCLIVWWLWPPGRDWIFSAWTGTWIQTWYFLPPSWTGGRWLQWLQELPI